VELIIGGQEIEIVIRIRKSGQIDWMFVDDDEEVVVKCKSKL